MQDDGEQGDPVQFPSVENPGARSHADPLAGSGAAPGGDLPLPPQPLQSPTRGGDRSDPTPAGLPVSASRQDDEPAGSSTSPHGSAEPMDQDPSQTSGSFVPSQDSPSPSPPRPHRDLAVALLSLRSSWMDLLGMQIFV